MHLILISISDSNVIILKIWTRSFLNQEKESNNVHSNGSKSIYISKFQLYLLMMNDQYILQVSKVFMN
jgi:hypothetical protein